MLQTSENYINTQEPTNKLNWNISYNTNCETECSIILWSVQYPTYSMPVKMRHDSALD